MEDERNLDRARAAALDQIRKTERARLGYLIAGGIYEFVLLVAFVLVADFSNKDHILLLFAACLVYGTLAFGLFALYAHLNVCTQRVLRAMEPGSDEGSGD